MDNQLQPDALALGRYVPVATAAALGFLAGLTVGARQYGPAAASTPAVAQAAAQAPETRTAQRSALPTVPAATPSAAPDGEPAPLATQAPPPDAPTPLGDAIHDYLGQRGFVMKHADRANGVVEWQHRESPLRVLGRFPPGESPIFERPVLRLVLERGDAVVWIANRVAIQQGLLFVDAGHGWTQCLGELSISHPRKEPEPARPLAPNEEMANGWRVTVAPLDESRRRRIFYELCAAQDAGVGDFEAYSVLAKRYGIDEGTVRNIAGEGAVKQWPLPPLP